MATKEELAEETKVQQLRQLAADNEVDLEGATTKDEIVAKIVASNKITKGDLEGATGDGDQSKSPTPAPQTGGLVNPAEAAKESFEGRTSDPASRKVGTDISETDSDINAGVHSSDSRDYEFPPGGDVDRSLLSTKKQKSETLAPVEIDSIVTLGDDKSVPKELVGHMATIVTKIDTDGTEQFTVRTRDEHNATLYVGREAFAEVHPGGVGIRGFGP